MTADPALDAVDRRGRTAAAAVRTAVAERPVPVFEPDLVRIAVDDRRTGSRRPVVGVLVAAAAVLVVVAAVVALTSTGIDDDGAPADRVAPGDLGRYVLSEPPDGYALTGVYDAAEGTDTGEGDDVSFGPLTLYGPDPETPVVGVYAMTSSEEELDLASSEAIPAEEVGGRQAWWSQGLVADDAAVVLVDGTYVAVVGVAAEREKLLGAVAAVLVEGDRAEVPDAGLPTGWDDLGEAHVYDLAPGAGLHTTDPGLATWLAAYSSADEGNIVVSVSGGDSVRARVAMVVTEDVEEVDVGGRTALLARARLGSDPSISVSITWAARSGEVVQVASTTEIDDDVLLGLARDLVSVGSDDLPDLRREVLEAEISTGEGRVIGRGSFAGGVDWALLYHGDDNAPSVELLTTAPPGDSDSSGSATATEIGPDGEPVASDPSPLADYTVGSDGDLRYAHGSIDAEVASVEVRDPATGDLVRQATVVEGAGLRAWVTDLPGGEDGSYEIRALAVDGTELDTVTISS